MNVYELGQDGDDVGIWLVTQSYRESSQDPHDSEGQVMQITSLDASVARFWSHFASRESLLFRGSEQRILIKIPH
jgi:hypothetical protein